jgi:eukaryotic-like serine/threonine-protein kinase
LCTIADLLYSLFISTIGGIGAGMAVPATCDELLDLVRKSGVADEKRLDALLREKRAAIPKDPKKVADFLIQNSILTNFQSENILLGKWKRFTIGKYKILERLGSGGFAQVYLCEHKLMRRRVAVKVLPVAKTKGSSALDRFHREARAAADLDHPNIVHAYDIDQDGELHFIVMEYVDGPNLQEIVKRAGRVSVPRACNYISQAALGLQHAFERNMVHRDIKPGNFIVDRSGIVKMLDLGLALREGAGENSQLTKMHEDGALGTADYIAPEQAIDSHEVDVRADIYSLGVTFYFLLAGRAPFEGLQIADKLMSHQIKTPAPLSDYRQDVPAEVQAIISKMMAKKPKDRYATPAEIIEALSPWTPTELMAPAEAEMPVLSPLAKTEIATTTGSGPVRIPTLASLSAGPLGTSPIGTATATAKTVAPPAKGAGDDAPWERFSTETDNAIATGDTVGPARPSKTKQTKSRKSVLFTIILVLGFVILPVCLTGVIFSALWWFLPPSETKRAEYQPLRLEVSKDPARTKAHRSISSALRNAETDTVIELWDENIEENVVFDGGAGMRTNITLQAAPGKQIVWKTARNEPNTPLLRLIKTPDFKLKGQGITLDGGLDKDRSVNDLIMITSDCSGMVIDDLQFRNFTREAVLIMNATGSPNRPIRLERLWTFTQEFEKPRAAIYFDANPKVMPAQNDHIEVSNCTFKGIDAEAAIQFNKDAARGDFIRVP